EAECGARHLQHHEQRRQRELRLRSEPVLQPALRPDPVSSASAVGPGAGSGFVLTHNVGVATVRGAAPFVAALALAAGFSRGSATQEPRADRKPVSFSNRLLLNRAAIAGLRSVEVMLAVDSGRIESTSQ